MFGLDVFGWAVVAGVAGVVAVIATVFMPFISDAILTRLSYEVIFDPHDSSSYAHISVTLINRGRSWIRIDGPAKLYVYNDKQEELVPLGHVVVFNLDFPSRLDSGEDVSSEFDLRHIAARLSEMGCTGTKQIVGEYRDGDRNVYRTKTPYSISIDRWLAEL